MVPLGSRAARTSCSACRPLATYSTYTYDSLTAYFLLTYLLSRTSSALSRPPTTYLLLTYYLLTTHLLLAYLLTLSRATRLTGGSPQKDRLGRNEVIELRLGLMIGLGLRLGLGLGLGIGLRNPNPSPSPNPNPNLLTLIRPFTCAPSGPTSAAPLPPLDWAGSGLGGGHTGSGFYYCVVGTHPLVPACTHLLLCSRHRGESEGQ